MILDTIIVSIIIISICICFTNVVAIQPLKDRQNQDLPLVPLTTEVPSQPNEEENQENKEELTLNVKVETLKEEDELKGDEETLFQQKAKSPMDLSSNSTISKNVDAIAWLFNTLGHTNNNTKNSSQIDSDTKSLGTIVINSDEKTLENGEGAVKTMAVPTPTQATSLSDDENSRIPNVGTTKGNEKNQNKVLVVRESETVRSCEVHAYGSVCTYVLLFSSSYYFHHMLQSF